MKLNAKILAVALTLIMLLGGCQTSDTSWAYSYEGDAMPSGVYICMLLNAYGDAASQLQSIQDEEIAVLAETASPEEIPTLINEMEPKDVYKLELEGMVVTDWMVREVEKSVRAYYATQAKMKELGLELSQEDVEAAEANAAQSYESMESQFKFYTENGIAESSLLLMMKNDYANHQLFHALYEEGGQLAVSDEELRQYYGQKYAAVNLMFFYKSTQEDLSEEDAADPEKAAQLVEEENNALRAKVQGYLDRIKGGEAIESISTEYETEYAQESVEGTEDEPPVVEPTQPGDLLMLTTEEQASYFGETLVRACFDTPVGEVVLVEDDAMYFIVEKLDTLSETPLSYMDNYRETMLHELRDSAFETQLEEWGAALELKANSAALKLYVPSKLYHGA